MAKSGRARPGGRVLVSAYSNEASRACARALFGRWREPIASHGEDKLIQASRRDCYPVYEAGRDKKDAVAKLVPAGPADDHGDAQATSRPH